jgi:hypothetical protein
MRGIQHGAAKAGAVDHKEAGHVAFGPGNLGRLDERNPRRAQKRNAKLHYRARLG